MSNAVAITRKSLEQLRLTGTQWRVLNQLLARLDPDTAEVRYSVGEIADDLGVTTPGVSMALTQLHERRIIEKLHRAHYRINSHLVGPVIDADPEPEWTRS